MLDRLIKKRNEPEPEFVDEKWIAAYIRKDVDYVVKSKVCEMVPFRLDDHGHKIYKTSVIKHRIMKYHMMPASTNHPLYEMSQSEAMVYLNICSPAKYLSHVRKGHIKVHTNADGIKKIYREDADEFLRTYDRLYLMQFVREPLVFTDAAMLLGVKRSTIEVLFKHKELVAEPRKKRERRKIGNETLLKYIARCADNGRRLRPNPIPDYMPRSIAEIYCSVIPEARNAVRARLIKSETYIDPRGKKKWGIRKDRLDALISKCWRGRCYGRDDRPYYTASNVEYIFGKSQAWINTFLRRKCPIVNKYGDPADPKKGILWGCGWEKNAVKAIVGSGVEYYPNIRLPKKIKNPEPKRFTTPKPKTMLVRAVADAIEMAVDNAYTERELAKEQHAREVARARNEAHREKEALRIELGFEPERVASISRRTVLKDSLYREIISLVYTSSGCNIYKDRSLSRYDLAVFVKNHDFRIRRRDVRGDSTTRLIYNGIDRSIMSHVHQTPEWIILVPGTSYINDINLYEMLRKVPSEIMAAAPFGYEYLQFDGTWTKCSRTYGFYQKYTLDPPGNEMVVGTAGVNGMHRVEVLDGPFVAIRGEMLDKFKEIHYFNKLGECRSSMGPIVSAVCRRYSLGMMQIPVSSACSSEYTVSFDTPKWHEIEDTIISYITASEEAIRYSRLKQICRK
jgi:hypothetical protein